MVSLSLYEVGHGMPDIEPPRHYGINAFSEVKKLG
jgi:hypothetical protein